MYIMLAGWLGHGTEIGFKYHILSMNSCSIFSRRSVPARLEGRQILCCSLPLRYCSPGYVLLWVAAQRGLHRLHAMLRKETKAMLRYHACSDTKGAATASWCLVTINKFCPQHVIRWHRNMLTTKESVVKTQDDRMIPCDFNLAQSSCLSFRKM